MADVQINDKELDSLNRRLLKAGTSAKNPVQKQMKIVLNKVNAKRVQNVRKAIRKTTKKNKKRNSGRLAKSFKKQTAWVSKKDKRAVMGRIYYTYQEYFGGEKRFIKTGKYNKLGILVHSASYLKGRYYAHIPEFGRRKGDYKGRHFMENSDNGFYDIAEYEKALYKATEDVILF